MTTAKLTRDDAKIHAKRLRAALADKGVTLNHGQSLDMVARQHGLRDWNMLSAQLSPVTPTGIPPVTLGDRVSGTYLARAFAGEVLGVARHHGGLWTLTIQFDEPVDVVSFDSFSAHRRRITAVVDSDGVSPAKTSDGMSHLVLKL